MFHQDQQPVGKWLTGSLLTGLVTGLWSHDHSFKIGTWSGIKNISGVMLAEYLLIF